MFSFGNKKADRRRGTAAASTRRPKLERRNAAKNIDYEASWAATSSGEPPPLRISRSLDLSPAACSKTTSVRIGGSVEDEVDLVCRSLGLSGPDDFAIPVAAWEASLKARSSSDLLPRSRFFDSDMWLPQPENPIPAPDLPPIRPRLASEVVRVRDEKTEEISRSSEHRSGGNDGGMKGIRTPVLTPPPLQVSFLIPSPAGLVLAPPPSIALPVEDRSSSSRDIVSCFALKDENERVDRARSLDSEEEEEEETSEGCTGPFSASNDDDLSSTTAEFVISPSGQFKKMIRSWMRGQLLGSGSFGTVYEGISDDGKFIAVKEVSLIDKGSNAQQCILQLEQEIALLSQFEHENIVQYYGTDKEESKLFIFLELVTQDFGLAKEISKFNDLKSCKGSVYWMAPEVVNPRKTYGRAPDIWSLGCTVLEMLTRQIPYPNVEWQHAFFKIGRGEQPPIPNHLSSDAQDFIRQCVQVDPNSRPTAAQLLGHPFVSRPVVI